MVEISQDQARLVARIVTDLIATSRDKLHATELDLGAVDAGRVINEVVASLGIAPKTTVMTDSATVVLADRERLTQIVTNLLTNADRYGRGAIICRAKPHNGDVEVEVHDNGPGVQARFSGDDLAAIRARPTPSRRHHPRLRPWLGHCPVPGPVPLGPGRLPTLRTARWGLLLVPASRC